MDDEITEWAYRIARLPGEPYLCICDDEWCWCENRVETLETPCQECADGHHVPTAGGTRS